MRYLKPAVLLSALGALTACGVQSTGHLGIGPQLGYTWSERAAGDRFSYGLEVSGGEFPYAKASAGWVRRQSAEASGAADGAGVEDVLYVAWEPWLYVGGTLGAAWSSDAGPGVVAGGWEGGYFVRPLFGGEVTEGELIPELSLAVGVRMLAGAAEVYITPKVNLRRRDGSVDSYFGEGGFFP